MDTANVQADLKSGSADESNSSFDLDTLDPETRQKVEEELKTELAKVSNLRGLWFCSDGRFYMMIHLDDETDCLFSIIRRRWTSWLLERFKAHVVKYEAFVWRIYRKKTFTFMTFCFSFRY